MATAKAGVHQKDKNFPSAPRRNSCNNANSRGDAIRMSHQILRLSIIPEKPIPNYLKPTISSSHNSTSRHNSKNQTPASHCFAETAAAARRRTPSSLPQRSPAATTAATRGQSTSSSSSLSLPQTPTTAISSRERSARTESSTSLRPPTMRTMSSTTSLPRRPSTAISSKERARRTESSSSKPSLAKASYRMKVGEKDVAPKKARSHPKITMSELKEIINVATYDILPVIPEEEEKVIDVVVRGDEAQDQEVEAPLSSSAPESKDKEESEEHMENDQVFKMPAYGSAVEEETPNKPVQAIRSKVKALAGAFESVFSSPKPKARSNQRGKELAAAAESGFGGGAAQPGRPATEEEVKGGNEGDLASPHGEEKKDEGVQSGEADQEGELDEVGRGDGTGPRSQLEGEKETRDGQRDQESTACQNNELN